MFNEKSKLWLRIFKVLVCIGSLGFVIGGLIFTSIREDISPFVWILSGLLLAFFNQVNGMLAANVIGNIQRIRECAEEMIKK